MQELFAFLIEELLGRSLTFSTRTFIWDMSFYAIQQRPWLGWGYSVIDPLQNISINNMASHNHILMVTYQSGILGLILFISLICMASYKLYKTKKSTYSNTLSFMLLITLVVMLMETVSIDYLFTLMIMSYHVDKLIAYDTSAQIPLAEELSVFSSKYIVRSRRKIAKGLSYGH
jgi:O-antigen ligase